MIWFAATIPSTVADQDTPTDAIVVLTGGSHRLEAGLLLLAAGKGRKLFVSGVPNGIELSELLHAAGPLPASLRPETLQEDIVLGHSADNTIGNAAETAEFMQQEGFHSLRLVTANYHLRRSLLEFSRAMPDIEILPNPVFPDPLTQRHWWSSPGTLWLIVNEYSKYLVVLIRPRPIGLPRA